MLFRAGGKRVAIVTWPPEPERPYPIQRAVPGGRIGQW